MADEKAVESVRANETPEPRPTSLKHELRTPINQIIGFGELLEEEAEADGHHHYISDLKKIGIAARDLLSKIDGIPLDGATPVAKSPGASPTPEVKSGEYVAPAGSMDHEQTDQPASILVVDDIELNRSMLSRRLKKKGFEVEMAEGGKEALEMLDNGAFDLVLLDIMMPDVSGYEVLEEVRKTRTPLELPIIMATAKDQGEDIVGAFKLGANDYITKPIDFPVALARIETQLSRKRAMEQSRRLTAELERHNQFIRKTFGRYLSKEVVESILSTPEGLRLGGEKRTITILMSDLRGFSALSEKHDPEQVVAMLNSYLGEMTEIVTHCNGTIDEFIGDAILALFGAPISRENDAERAIACALQMQLAMKEVNARNREKGFPDLEMGIALNTGECVVGNIGSQQRAKYGVVGSHVNLTGRIESYTVGGQILVSKSTVEAVETELELGSAIELGAKGFKEPVTVYELRGIGGNYDLHLPEPNEDLRHLLREIPIGLQIIEGKHVADERSEGKILSLSMRAAEISSEKTLSQMENVRMQLHGLNGVIIPGDLYAKVTGVGDNRYAIRFTSVPDNIKSFLRSTLANEVG